MAYFNLILLEERIVLDAAIAAVIYVNAAQTTHAQTGADWAHAYNNLQDALQAAANHPGSEQIWVAQGTYVPGEGQSFSVPSLTSIYGGFNGTETRLNQRDPGLYHTVLSGDNLGNDLANPTDPGYALSKADNALHVVTLMEYKGTLSGLTIENGYADKSAGGGIFASGGNFTLSQVSLLNNVATENPSLPPDIFNPTEGIGGGIYITLTSKAANVTIDRSLFQFNLALGLGTGQGSGIYSNGAAVSISDTAFLNNSGENCATIVFKDGSSTVENSLFEQNISALGCSGIWYESIGSNTIGQHTLDNSQFIDNTGFDCGAVRMTDLTNTFLGMPYSKTVPKMKVTNNLFDGNSALMENENPLFLTCGAICDYSYNAIFSGNTFINNNGLNGGALCVDQPFENKSLDVTIKDNVFTSNHAIDPNVLGAGAVHILAPFPGGNNDVKIYDNQFLNNTSATKGGALIVEDSTATIKGNDFSGNAAPEGSAIWASNAILNDVLKQNKFANLDDNTIIIV